MTLTKKIFLGLSALFIIPELIWSPLLNIFFALPSPSFVLRKTSFVNFSPNTISSILILQIIGLFSLTLFFLSIIKGHSGWKKFLIIIASGIGIILTLIALLFTGLSFTLRNMGW